MDGWLLIGVVLVPFALSAAAGSGYLLRAGRSVWRVTMGGLMVSVAFVIPIAFFGALSELESDSDLMAVILVGACALGLLLPIVALIGDLWRRTSW